MKPVADLFPETLLVSADLGHTFTDSVRVAAHFHKLHKNVLRVIEQVVADVADAGGSGLNFELTSYKVKQSKTRPMYLMDRKAFAILAGRFTGKQALLWQIQYHDAFEAMERQLSAQRDRYVGALDILCPPLRPTVERTQGDQDRISIASVIGKSCASVTYYRAKARRLGLLPA